MILALAAQIFIGTVLAYIIYLVIIGRAGATNAALVTFLIPIVTILLGTLILGERPAPSAYLGMVVIFIGTNDKRPSNSIPEVLKVAL